jgi:hypothetical protein
MKFIRAKFDSICLSCEEEIGEGEGVWWEPGIGVWHKDCDIPRSLNTYISEKNKARQLGIDPTNVKLRDE